jgi:multidrug resistance efflux pump
MSSASVATGPPLPEPEQLRIRAEQAGAYAADCERAVPAIEAKIEGMRETLKAARAEAKRARTAADDLAELSEHANESERDS